MTDETPTNDREKTLIRLCLQSMRARADDTMLEQPEEIERDYSEEEISDTLHALEETGAIIPHPRYHPSVNLSAYQVPKLWIRTDKGDALLEILERDQ